MFKIKLKNRQPQREIESRTDRSLRERREWDGAFAALCGDQALAAYTAREDALRQHPELKALSSAVLDALYAPAY